MIGCFLSKGRSLLPKLPPTRMSPVSSRKIARLAHQELLDIGCPSRTALNSEGKESCCNSFPVRSTASSFL